MDETGNSFNDPALYLDLMAVGLFQQWLRELNDDAPFLDVDALRGDVDSNVEVLNAVSTNVLWPETNIGSGSMQDHILRSLRLIDASEIAAYAEVYHRYVDALGINGVYALLSSTYEKVPTDSAWYSSFDHVWGARLREKHGTL